MTQVQHHTSPLLLGKLLAGKATEDEVRTAEAHAQACARCSEELAEARAAARRFTESVFPRTRPAVEGRRRPARSWRLLLPVVLAAAAAVVLFVRRPPPELPRFQVKGGGALSVFALRGGESFRVGEGTALRAGDRIRFGVVAGDARFVLVASVDGRGQVSIYQPSIPVSTGEGPMWILPDSIVLDDAPGPERIFALFSDRPVEEPAVTAALTALGAAGTGAIRGTTRLPLSYMQASVLIEKAAAPAP